ncbi:MAG: site-2 protease family protein [archaeon]
MPKTKFQLSKTELKHLFISWLVISIALAFALTGINENLLMTIPASMLVTATAFIFHELAHKYTAIHFGAKAEYRAWMSGLVFALLLAVTVRVVFAAPGAVYIFGKNISKRENGLISFAGPATNIVLGVIFLVLWAFVNPLEGSILGLALMWGAFINFFLAFFNMIPIGPLDGKKILAWNWMVWTVTFIPLAGIIFLSFFGTLI